MNFMLEIKILNNRNKNTFYEIRNSCTDINELDFLYRCITDNNFRLRELKRMLRK